MTEALTRPYSDPTRGWVRGALEEGVSDPKFLVDPAWTPQQKDRWSKRFGALVAEFQAEAAEERERELNRGAKALGHAISHPPVLRDVATGAAQGAADLASLGLRVIGRGEQADALNRQAEENEAIFKQAGEGKGELADLLQGGVRGAARSIATMAPLARTGVGAYGVIGGFAASRANQAITEATDAGLKGSERAAYVGRAALIEGGVASVFQRIGWGGAESWITGGVTRQSLGSALKHTFAELAEENITEILDAANQALSKVTDPMTAEQAWEVVKQTTVTTLLTMGAIQGFRAYQGRQERAGLVRELVDDWGWKPEQAAAVIDRAAERSENAEDFGKNLGFEVQAEARLTPIGLARWVVSDPQAAVTLAKVDNPSRALWRQLGLPERSQEERARIVGVLRGILPEELMAQAGPQVAPPARRQPEAQVEAPPAEPAPPAEAPAAAQVTPPAPEAPAAQVPPVEAPPPRLSPDEGDPTPEAAAAALVSRGPGGQKLTPAQLEAKAAELRAQAEELRRRTAERMAAEEVEEGEDEAPLVQPDATAVGMAGRAAEAAARRAAEASEDTDEAASAAQPAAGEGEKSTPSPAKELTAPAAAEIMRRFRAEFEARLDEAAGMSPSARSMLTEQSNAAIRRLLGTQATEHQVREAMFSVFSRPAGKSEPEAQKPAGERLADSLAEGLSRGETFDWRRLQAHADEAYGGKLSEHAWSMQDAYEAMEVALNVAGQRRADVPAAEAKATVAELTKLLERAPTQTTRSAEKDDFQQFSTPLPYAYAATWVGAPRKGEVVLEPSGGTGSLLTHAQATTERTIGNEWDKGRAKLLARFASEVFTEDAEQIHNILPSRTERPTLVLMNPPFSKAGQRMKGKKVPLAGAKHVEAALETLAPGGRLVAIVGRGMTMDAPTYLDWWGKIGGAYHVRANVGVSGKVYAKQGTSFATRLLVIDKTMPEVASPIVKGEVETVEALIDLLEEVRNDRPAGPADRTEVGGAPQEPGGPEAGGVAPDGAPPVDPAQRGGDAPGEGELPGGPGAVRGAEAPAAGGQRGGDVAPGRGGRGRGSRARAGRAEGAAPGAAPQQVAGEGAGLPAAERPGLAEATKGLEVKAADRVAGEEEGTFESYQPAMTVKGAKPHPTPLVESAAMASVQAPVVDYRPKIPQRLIDEGKISAAQLEPIVYAGHMHQQTVPMSQAEREEFEKLTGKPAPEVKRRGFFIGDGTGVGKGREAAGIILDNFEQGRRRAIWISERPQLALDATRDWVDLGGKKSDILALDKVKAGLPIKKGDGIVFGSYGALGMSSRPKEIKPGEEKPLTRVEQLVQWFGEDFDGAVIFDEAHNAANAVETKGSRGKGKSAARALMMVELQRRLPNARVVYLSATGATQVSNLAYADRLGLWGEGTEFANRDAFVNGVTAGGVAAMELVARDMKAQNMYVARTLSFKGVGYSRLTHALTEPQRATYDTLAGAWQTVLQNIHEALQLTSPSDKEGSVDPKQKSAALSAFWGAHQRFFNQVLTAIQMPSVLASLKADLKAGRAPVIQLVNTLEASTERALSKLSEEEGELDELDITPRDMLMQMVEKSFPVTQMEEYTDANGNTQTRPVKDSSGNPVLNAEAVALRDKLLDQLADIAVPDSPLDQIIRAFGAHRVAEVTGRKRRVVEVKGKREIQNRTKAQALDDVRAFLDGERDLLIFSEAGATGASYHADLTKKNQKPRRHYVLQAGWRADKAIQGLGRSHRSNQAQAPEFLLVETDLPGHRRFISTIARRLEQLGALSRGQRTAGGGGLFSESDNLEGTHAQDALQHLLKDVAAGKAEGIDVQEFEQQTGLKIVNDQGMADGAHVKVSQFLNRLLSLKIDMQNRVFEAYSKRLDQAIEYARQTGTLDVGMETIKAAKIEKASERVIRTDERSGAQTSYVQLRVFNPSEKHRFEDHEKDALFVRNVQSGQGYTVQAAGTRTDDRGNIQDMFARWGPRGKKLITAAELREKHERIGRDEAKASWDTALAAIPPMHEETVHLITGALLPVWSRIRSRGKPLVRRATTVDGERFLGRVVAEDDIAEVLGNLGLEHKIETPSAERAQALLLQGGVIEFANGWSLRTSRVRDELAIEVGGVTSPAEGDLLVGMGGRKERHGFKNRYFLPRGAGFDAAYARLVKGYEVARVIQGTDDERMFAPEDPRDPPPEPPNGGGLRAPEGSNPDRGVQAVEVINLIRDQWKVVVRGPATFRKQFKTERALGWYTPGLGEMRLREAHDVVTAIHELGHHFDRELGKWSARRDLSPQIQAELRRLGEDLYGPGDKASTFYKSEGFAEFIREWLVGAGDLQARAPALSAWFGSEYLPENPEEARKIARLQDAVRLLLVQTSRQAVRAFRSPTQVDWSAERIAGKVAATIDSKIRDTALPILRAMQETGADLSKVAPHRHPYILATHFARSAGGRTKHAALEHTVDVYGRVTGPGLQPALKPVLDQGDEVFEDWQDYLVARRALERYHAHGLDPGLSRKDAEAIVREHESKPHFKDTAQAFTDFADRALEPLVQSGRMTEAQRARIRLLNPIYAPFMRRFDKSAASVTKATGQQDAVHRVRRGSKLPIHDLLDAMLAQYERIQQVAMQHEVMRSMVAFYDEQKAANRGGQAGTFLARFMSEIPASRESVKFQAGQIRPDVMAALRAELDEESFAKAEEALEEFWDERLTVYRARTTAPRTGAGEDPAMAIVVNGRRRFFQLKPELIPILEGVAHSTFLPGTLGAIVRGATALTRLGATGLNPTFSLISNTLRDAATAAITADYSFQIPLLSTYQGVVMHMTGHESAVRYDAAGLGMNSMIGQDMDAAKRLSNRVRHGWKAALTSPLDLTDAVRDFLSKSEIGPRLIEFDAAYRHGLERWGDERAALVLAGAASKDATVNFTRAGTWSRQANEVIPFFNAAVQSIDKLARAAGVLEPAPWAKSQDRAENARRTVARGALLLTATALLLWLRRRDDDKWKELPAHEKWGFLHVWRFDDGTFLRLPLPFEAGALFGALPIALLEESRSPGAFREALGIAFKNATPFDFDFSSLHPWARNAAIAAPIVDVIANKDWKGSPIVSGRKRMLAQDRVDYRTTTLAQYLAKFAPGKVSPIELDHILDGYSGGLWRRVLGGPDMLAAMRSDDPASWPVLRVLFTRPTTSRLVGDFYDRLTVLQERQGSKVATLEELGELAAAERLDRALDKVWADRRDAFASDRSRAERDKAASDLLESAQAMIREHLKRDRADDRASGLGSLVYRATEPSAKTADLLSGLEAGEQEALAALRAEAARRAKARGQKPNLQTRDSSGALTPFGRRQAALVRALRARQPAAPSSASGS